MKKRILVYAIYVFLIVLFQSTILDFIKIQNIKPNLIIVFTVTIAMVMSTSQGAAIGFLLGLCQDITTGKVLGFYSLLGLYLGIFTGLLNRRFFKENLIVIIFINFVTSTLYEIIVFLFTKGFESNEAFLYCLKTIVIPEAIYNSLLSIPVYLLVLKMADNFEGMHQMKRRY